MELPKSGTQWARLSPSRRLDVDVLQRPLIFLHGAGQSGAPKFKVSEGTVKRRRAGQLLVAITPERLHVRVLPAPD